MIKDGTERYNKLNKNLRIKIEQLCKKLACIDNNHNLIGMTKEKEQRVRNLELVLTTITNKEEKLYCKGENIQLLLHFLK